MGIKNDVLSTIDGRTPINLVFKVKWHFSGGIRDNKYKHVFFQTLLSRSSSSKSGVLAEDSFWSFVSTRFPADVVAIRPPPLLCPAPAGMAGPAPLEVDPIPNCVGLGRPKVLQATTAFTEKQNIVSLAVNKLLFHRFSNKNNSDLSNNHWFQLLQKMSSY